MPVVYYIYFKQNINTRANNYVFSQLSINAHAAFKDADHERDDGRRANIDGHTTYNYDSH